jgi:chromosome segregation ATPase
MDSRVPKNEREWWAGREIEKLERELTAANKGWQLSSQSNELCLRELYKVRDELTAEQAERERSNDGLKMAEAMVRATTDRSDTFRAELTRLRAELASKTACYDIACGEVQRLRAEVERLKGEVTDWELAFQEQYARAEKAEAERDASNKRLADCEFLSQHRYKIIQRQEPRCNEAIARAERAEASLAAIEEDGTEERNAAVGLRQKLVAALDRAEKAEAECVRLKSLGSWAHTCVHHNDAERKAAMCCPVCEQTRSQKIETALKDAISTYFGDDKLVTAERIEAWQAALKDNK